MRRPTNVYANRRVTATTRTGQYRLDNSALRYSCRVIQVLKYECKWDHKDEASASALVAADAPAENSLSSSYWPTMLVASCGMTCHSFQYFRLSYHNQY